AEGNSEDHISGVSNRFPKEMIAAKHPAIVSQTDEPGRTQNVVVTETNDDRKENGSSGQGDEANEPGGGAEPPAAPLGTKVAAAPSVEAWPPRRWSRFAQIKQAGAQNNQRKVNRHEVAPGNNRATGRTESEIQLTLHRLIRFIQRFLG